MLKTEEWLLIHNLYLQGLNISEISKETGFDRKTMRKYLQLKTLSDTQKRPRRSSKLDPFKPYIIVKLNEGPYIAARLYREIKEMGFDPTFRSKFLHIHNFFLLSIFNKTWIYWTFMQEVKQLHGVL